MTGRKISSADTNMKGRAWLQSGISVFLGEAINVAQTRKATEFHKRLLVNISNRMLARLLPESRFIAS